MTKKRKTTKKRKPANAAMVIWVEVPAEYAERIKAWQVLGLLPDPNSMPYSLRILRAYYDRRAHR